VTPDDQGTNRVSRREPTSDAALRRNHLEAPRVRRPPANGAATQRATTLTRDHQPAAGSETREMSSGPTIVGVPLRPGWQLAPLRLFLGVTFCYAGVQKLTDPQFFKPTAARYIGRQIQAFAHGSPIRGLLLHLALPHAALFGGLIAYGEIAIGLGVLVGLLARPAAGFGLLLSLIFFLSASWNVHPYFYGADIVFTFAWLALGLAPHAGLPSLDVELARRLAARGIGRTQEQRLVMALAFSVPPGGDSDGSAAERSVVPARGARGAVGGSRPAARHGARSAYQQRESRRSFLWGLASGVAGAIGVVWLWGAMHSGAATGEGSSIGGGNSTPSSGTGTSTAGTATPASGSNVIARASDVPVNSAATFTIPSNGDPGVVVHLGDGRFVAYDATCTHAGCPVQYDAGSKDLYCPCHGAVFDPANQAAVLQGPADTPLAPVAISVQSNGDITLTG
jgi:thiosulfate dehydrogenase (quinone) large subunit